MKIWIMRGLPGAGKSTWIEQNFDKSRIAICSADKYHMIDGVYKYDRSRAGHAHGQCLKLYTNALVSGPLNHWPTDLFVDNTNTIILELAPYVRLAEAFGYTYEIIYIVCDPLLAFKRNIHGVPAEGIMVMYQALISEKLPTYLKQTIILGDY